MENTSRILLLGEEKEFGAFLATQLTSLGFACDLSSVSAFDIEALREGNVDVALIDASSSDDRGYAILERIAETDLGAVPILVARLGEIADPSEAVRLGAFDIILKPVSQDTLSHTINRAVRHRRVGSNARRMAEEIDHWQATFDAIPDFIFLVDDDFHVMRANKAMVDRLGVSAEALKGQTCYSVVGGYDRPPKGCPHALVLKGVQACCGRADSLCLGENFITTASALTDSRGHRIGSVVVARDVSELNRMYGEVARSHKEVERLIEAMSSFLIELDAELRVVRWNKAAEKTFGILSAQAVGAPLLECGLRWSIGSNNDPLDAVLPAWSELSHPIHAKDIRYKRSDDAERILAVDINPIAGDDGKQLGLFFLGTDVTDLKNLESQLVQAQKLESIGQLAAGIAHEINTPTQYVGDNVEFLQYSFDDLIKLLGKYGELLEAVRENRSAPDLVVELGELSEELSVEFLSEQIPRAITQSRDGINRIAEIVRAMKEFSHPGADEKTPVDINRAIQSTITVARNEWKYVAEVVTEFEPSLPMVPVLPGEFNQVVLNLLVNAAHAIGDSLGGNSGAKGKITVRTLQDGHDALVCISDTGTGIPKEIQSRVFDPFFTTKKVGRGTGQGLAIAHNVIVEKHGGSLTFDTELGKGTTFYIRLPM